MSDTQNELLSFLSNDSKADSPKEQSLSDVQHEELDTEDSYEDESTDDGQYEYDEDEDSTADDDEEYDESEDDSTETDEDESSEEDDSTDKANKFDDSDFTITVDGEELTVKGSELKSGYMRREAFTKKTQEVAEQRKALDAELTKAVERSEAVKFNATIEMERLDGVLKQIGGWDGLKRQATPEQYEQFTNRYVQAKKDSEIADDIYNETVNSMRSSNAKQIEVILKDMGGRHPNFTSSTINDMDKFLSNRGFTEDMVLSMTSPEAWDIVYEAMQYQKLQARTQENVKAEKKKEIDSKSHKAAPVKKANQKSSTQRDIDKGLKAQKKARGKEQSAITQDLLKKIL